MSNQLKEFKESIKQQNLEVGELIKKRALELYPVPQYRVPGEPVVIPRPPGSSMREDLNKWLGMPHRDTQLLDLLGTGGVKADSKCAADSHSAGNKDIVVRKVGGDWFQVNVRAREGETLREALERLLNDTNGVKEEEDK